MYRLPVIIDVDTGLDDAMVLAMACALPELDVRAVTVCFGNNDLPNTLRNTLNMLKLCGREDIPVGAGADRPLVRPTPSYGTDGHFVHGPGGLGGVTFPFPDATAALSDKSAPDLMHQVLRESDQPVTILCLGAHTNAARLLLKYPEDREKIRCFVNMGGLVRAGLPTVHASARIFHDPEGAAVLLASGSPFYMCPGDLTALAMVTLEEMEELRRFRSPVGRTVSAIMDAYYKTCSSLGEQTRNGVTGQSLHDPCALAFLVHPEFFTYGRYWARVETQSDLCLAMTVIDYENTLGVPQAEKNLYLVDGILRRPFARFFLDTIRRYEEGGEA